MTRWSPGRSTLARVAAPPVCLLAVVASTSYPAEAASAPRTASPGATVSGRLTMERHSRVPTSFRGLVESNAVATATFALPLALDDEEPDGSRTATYLGSGSYTVHIWGHDSPVGVEPCTWDRVVDLRFEDAFVSYAYAGPQKGRYSLGGTAFTPDDWAGDCETSDVPGNTWSVEAAAESAHLSGTRTSVYEGGTGAQVESWDVPVRIGGGGCGSGNQVVRVWTASGKTYGLTGTTLAKGQSITAREDIELTLRNGNRFRLRQGSVARIIDCSELSTKPSVILNLALGRVWAWLTAGGAGEPMVQTDRAMTGPRGTAFSVTYNRARLLTTVEVTSGAVSLTNRYGGAKRAVLVRPGQRATQIGNSPPTHPVASKERSATTSSRCQDRMRSESADHDGANLGTCTEANREPSTGSSDLVSGRIWTGPVRL